MPVPRQDVPAAPRHPQARTRLARGAVVRAARAEFLDHGYGATTIDAISARADVPSATVYRLFGSKLGILKAVIDVALAGDDEDVALPDRPQIRSPLQDPDPAQRIAGFAHIAAEVNARTSALYRILVGAAGSDPDAAALLADLQRQRRQGQGMLTQSLARSHMLRPRLRQRDAADIVHALMSPELYRLLVVDSGWTSQRYERWLAAALTGQLLP